MKILAENPDISIVFSDMKMPDINGIEFIEMARKDYQGMHFFIVTGYDIDDEIESALKNGVIQKYFRKPFQIAEIMAAIAKGRQ